MPRVWHAICSWVDMKYTKQTIGALVLIISLAVSGCSTVKGLGKDIERAGEEMEDALD